VASTQFNGVNVFTGPPTTIQSGNGGDENSQIALQTPSVPNQNFDISTQAGAQAAIDGVGTQIQALAAARGSLGADEVRLQLERDRANDSTVVKQGALSRIRDSDIADDTAQRVGAQIREQIDVALAAQANVDRRTALKLLS
jgi:flagellin